MCKLANHWLKFNHPLQEPLITASQGIQSSHIQAPLLFCTAQFCCCCCRCPFSSNQGPLLHLAIIYKRRVGQTESIQPRCINLLVKCIRISLLAISNDSLSLTLPFPSLVYDFYFHAALTIKCRHISPIMWLMCNAMLPVLWIIHSTFVVGLLFAFYMKPVKARHFLRV